MEAGIILRKAQKYSLERWNYHSPTTIIDYTNGFKAAIEMMEKNEVKNLAQPDVSGSVAFAKWIGERMNVDSWFRYDERFGKWYWHMKGHLTTEELYEVFVATDR